MFGSCSAPLFSVQKTAVVQASTLPSRQYKHCHGKLS
jgi:hypothetical protein